MIAQNRPLRGHSGAARSIVTAQLVRRGSVVIAVFGEVDARSGPVLHTLLQEHVRKAGPDLVAVSFLSIAGLATLMAVWEATVTAEVEFDVVPGLLQNDRG
ncbi:hypothetical protein LX88_004215 [Lentzea californiensis]|nr:hypothetical protein [Lentzea californiensis]